MDLCSNPPVGYTEEYRLEGAMGTRGGPADLLIHAATPCSLASAARYRLEPADLRGRGEENGRGVDVTHPWPAVIATDVS
nr:unnamed protein product [Digitaria exilis]